MRILLQILCAVILFNSCKLAGFEKRRYRKGYFVQVRSKKDKIQNETSLAKKLQDPEPEIVIIKDVQKEEPQDPGLVASAGSEQKVNINKLLPIRTTFVNEHLKESKQKIQRKKKFRYKENDRTLYRALVIAIFLAIFFGVAALFKLLIPGISWLICFYFSASFMLLLFLLLFLGTKNSSQKCLPKIKY